MSKPQVQGSPVPGWTVDPDSLGLYRDRLGGTWSWDTQDSLLVPSLEILENSRIRAWGLGAARPSSHRRVGEMSAREGRDSSRSHDNQLQVAGLGSRTPGMWFQLCCCLAVLHWASGPPCP